MMRRSVRGHDIHARRLVHQGASGRMLAALALVALVALAGCATQGHAQAIATHAPTATVPVPTVTPTVATTPVPTSVVVTDLNAFRQQVVSAMGSGQWSALQALLSPDFSFQTPNAGSHLLMPDAAQHLDDSVKAGNPWSQSDSYFIDNHNCYAGNTPVAQVIGFVGNNNHFIMFGIDHPSGQANWLVIWGFEDPQGPYDGCIGPG